MRARHDGELARMFGENRGQPIGIAACRGASPLIRRIGGDQDVARLEDRLAAKLHTVVFVEAQALFRSRGGNGHFFLDQPANGGILVRFAAAFRVALG